MKVLLLERNCVAIYVESDLATAVYPCVSLGFIIVDNFTAFSKRKYDVETLDAVDMLQWNVF